MPGEIADVEEREEVGGEDVVEFVSVVGDEIGYCEAGGGGGGEGESAV